MRQTACQTQESHTTAKLRLDENARWEIHVRPDGDGTVTIALSATTDCDARGAVCAEDGRMLPGRLEVSVPGTKRYVRKRL